MTISARNKIAFEVFQKVQNDVTKNISYIHKDCLRFLLNRFGGLVYYDGQNNKKDIKCLHANPEREVGIIFKESTIVLPLVTISESATDTLKLGQRYEPILIDEKYWSDKYQRAIRIVSLTPKPIEISYGINIWSFYKNDMDQIREMIFSMFNPDMNITISEKFACKIYIDSESDASETKVPDQEDRILQKTIGISLQTAIPAPRFLYTSTGKIEKLKFEVDAVTGKLTQDSATELSELLKADMAETDVSMGGGSGGIPEHSHEQYVTPEELQSMTWLTN
jgi:hypothetical protein